MLSLGVLERMLPLGGASVDASLGGREGGAETCVSAIRKSLSPQNSSVAFVWSLNSLASNSTYCSLVNSFLSLSHLQCHLLSAWGRCVLMDSPELGARARSGNRNICVYVYTCMCMSLCICLSEINLVKFSVFPSSPRNVDPHCNHQTGMIQGLLLMTEVGSGNPDTWNSVST